MPRTSYYFDPKDRGDVWVSSNGKIVEWYVENQCVKKYVFTQRAIKAGFTDFETVSDCLLIIFEDHAYVYNINTGHASTICFPFPISNAFWYTYGVVLERKFDLQCTHPFLNDLLEDAEPTAHRYITLTDPMSPFGFVGVSTHQKNAYNEFQNSSNLQMLCFPRDSNTKITTLYDTKQNSLDFYLTKIIQPTATTNTSTPVNEPITSSETTHAGSLSLRKVSLMNKRSTSINLLPDNQYNFDGIPVNNTASKRSVSATVDRMTSGYTAASPVLDFQPLSAATPTSASIPSISTARLQDFMINQSITSKDIILTKIASLSLPPQIASNSSYLKCLPLHYHDQEAIIISDTLHKFTKVWLIDLKTYLNKPYSFRAYGNLPKQTIKLLDVPSNGNMHISNILPYYNNNIPGLAVVTYQSSNMVLVYQPFLDLTYHTNTLLSIESLDEICSITEQKCTISRHAANTLAEDMPHFLPYPQKRNEKLYLKAIQKICPPSFFYDIVFLWQFTFIQLSAIKKTPQDPTLEFHALELVLLSLLNGGASSDKINNSITETIQFHRLMKYEVNNILPKVIMGLHLIREELMLDVVCDSDTKRLGAFLYIAISTMNWPSPWKEYYKWCVSPHSINYTYTYSTVSPINFTHPLDEPPSIFKSLYSITENSEIPLSPFINFSRLIESEDTKVDEELTPRTFKLLTLYEMAHASNFVNNDLIHVLARLDISRLEIETYPTGVLIPLRKMLQDFENNLSQFDGSLNLKVITRLDLERCKHIASRLQNDVDRVTEKMNNHDTNNHPYRLLSKEKDNTLKDIHSILMDILRSNKPLLGDYNPKSLMKEDSATIDEGQDLKRNAAVIFAKDKRFPDALALLIYYKPHLVQFFTTRKNYVQIVNQKKHFAKTIALRTCASGIGWGAVAYATEKPLSTQRWIKPELNLVSLFADGTKVSVEPADIDKDIYLWGQFHGGVSSGLRISRKATTVNGSWIAFNKPKELGAQHGGFLMGLGLNGHLKNLEEWHVYNYLSPKNTHTSIGLLLGMSASMKGSMDMKLTKVLSVHIVALLPPGSSDLNISIEVQTAGLVGVGLLYQNSQHRRMTDLLSSQLTSLVAINEEYISDQSYRIAAGIALGLVNLGAGDQIGQSKFIDPPDAYEHPEDNTNINNDIPLEAENQTVDFLLDLAISTHDMEQKWILENSRIGSVLALMLTFLKTKNQLIAAKLKPNFEANGSFYGRPELFMYREWSYHMILWDSIGKDLNFVLGDIDVKLAESVTSDKLPAYYKIAGRVVAMGIKFSCTNDTVMRDDLIILLDHFLPFYQYHDQSSVDHQLAINGINILVNVIIVALSMIMCGSGDLIVFRRVRYLHEIVTGKGSDLFKRAIRNKQEKGTAKDVLGTSNHREDDTLNGDLLEEEEEEEEEAEDLEEEEEAYEFVDPTEEKDNTKDDERHYGKFLATSMSLGFLFLGSGQYALNISNIESIAYIIISVLPLYMSPYNLQELKHFWALAVEPRCMTTRDVFTEEPINGVAFDITIQNLDHKLERKQLFSPCLLPDLRQLVSIRINEPNYYPLEINFGKDMPAIEFFKNGVVLYLQRRNSQSSEMNDENGIKNIQLYLQRRLAEKNHKNRRESSTDGNCTRRLLNTLDIQDSSFCELGDVAAQTSYNNSNSQKFNVGMAISDALITEQSDYELEVWRRSHRL